MTVDIYAADEQSDHEIDLARWVALAQSALGAEGVEAPAEVSLIFCNEDTIAELNEQFMGKTGPTDVLSFPIEAEPEISGRVPDAGTTGPDSHSSVVIPRLVGDILICPKVAAANAKDHEVSFDDEVALLVVHGVLHLLGWDHMIDAEAELMEARERELLGLYYAKGNS